MLMENSCLLINLLHLFFCSLELPFTFCWSFLIWFGYSPWFNSTISPDWLSKSLLIKLYNYIPTPTTLILPQISTYPHDCWQPHGYIDPHPYISRRNIANTVLVCSGQYLTSLYSLASLSSKELGYFIHCHILKFIRYKCTHIIRFNYSTFLDTNHKIIYYFPMNLINLI